MVCNYCIFSDFVPSRGIYIHRFLACTDLLEAVIKVRYVLSNVFIFIFLVVCQDNSVFHFSIFFGLLSLLQVKFSRNSRDGISYQVLLKFGSRG